ncbi:MAG: HD domain-containing protein [Rhodospirillales bacterium]|nr:HD domain-containing protein [Rhodospirillales bacterium]
MPGTVKPQRIRDPLHNLIEFGTDQFEHVLWKVIETRPFQRLRRIRQLGFSDLVYPGATHTRFAHSLGVFHTARQLMTIIRRHITQQGGQVKDHQLRAALAAALVHDIGHGMLSHAFEDVGKKLNLKMAHHEHVSDLLIRDSEVSEAFKSEMGSGFATDVADVIGRGRPGNLYDAVVSSQFDADRLDYMQRDRLMTGVQNSGIDFVWLMANLEIGTVPIGVDGQQAAEIETFVLGPKASYAAETYVLALFQLYPTVYFHKTTRAAEKVFSALMLHLMTLALNGDAGKTGLPTVHPIVRFALEPNQLVHALSLDDTVFWGALPMLIDAQDPLVRELATRLRDRRLPKCMDIYQQLVNAIAPEHASTVEDRDVRRKRLKRAISSIEERLQIWSNANSEDAPRILTDSSARAPYKSFQESKGPLNQIRIRSADDRILDMAESSRVVASIETFELFRAYFDDADLEARSVVESTIEEELRSDSDG